MSFAKVSHKQRQEGEITWLSSIFDDDEYRILEYSKYESKIIAMDVK